MMGEPLAHPDFAAFVAIAGEEGVSLEITTNGTLLTNEAIAALLSPAVVQVNFSLQSFLDNFPSADPSAYLEKVFAFCRRALAERPELYLNLRLWNLPPGTQRDQANEELLQKIEAAFGVNINRQVDSRRIKSKKLTGRLYLHYDTRFRWPDSRDPVLRTSGTCWGTRSHIGVHVDGTVVPCCLDKEARISLGNLNHATLAEVLASPRYQAMRRGFISGQLTEDLCRRCTYAERFGEKV